MTGIGHIIHEWSDRSFVYGKFDCCQFAAAVYVARTGQNPLGDMSYASERQALRIISKFGSLENAVRHYIGEPISVESAGHGDIVLMETDQGEALGVIYLGQVVALSPNGLRSHPSTVVKMAWTA